MYVCVCNAVKAQTIKDLADEGLSFDEIQAVTNCAGSCGTCLEFAEALVSQSRHKPLATLPVLQL